MNPSDSISKRLRMCVACRQLYSVDSLHRLTVQPASGLFSINQQPSLKGRSAYVCRSVECLSGALSARKFHKALKRPIPDDIVVILGGLLETEKQKPH